MTADLTDSLPALSEELTRLRQQAAALARAHSVLSAASIHGPAHWARVERHARELCAETGADPRVPVLFALLHDSCRVDDGFDLEHGPRAAAWVRSLAAKGCLALGAGDLGLLTHAMEEHTLGAIEGPLVEQICWDADRLDLGRIGVIPDPARLCTEAARQPDRIARAVAWAEGALCMAGMRKPGSGLRPCSGASAGRADERRAGLEDGGSASFQDARR